MKAPVRAEQIDALLPQTQCGQCEFSGCRPYANALSENKAAINRCPPGGIETLLELASLLEKDPGPFLDEMQQKAKPATRAVIREEECIGCTKCLQVCPTDAILGSHKQMHTVITDACTGCELCLAPCPVDCIDLLPVEKQSPSEKKQKADAWRTRFEARQLRLLHKTQRLPKKQADTPTESLSLEARQKAIQEAVQRVRHRKKERRHE